MSKLADLIDFLFPRYISEGKSQLTIGFGCTGGRHRSVYVAHQLCRRYEHDERIEIHLDTRDATR